MLQRIVRFTLATLLWATAVLALSPAIAQDDLLTNAARVLSEVEAAIPAQRDDYDGLLQLRNRVEGVRNDLRARVATLEITRAELQAQTAQLGAKPAGDEPEDAAAERARLAQAQASFEATWRPTLLMSQRSEQLWNRITQIRRTIFASRLFMHVASILDPYFWREIATDQLPRFANRSHRLAERWIEHVRVRDTGLTDAVLLVAVLLVTAAFVWMRRSILRRRREVESATTVTPLAAIRRGATTLLLRSVPLPLAALILVFVVRRLDMAPDDVQSLLLSGVLALFAAGTSRGAAAALLSPKAPRWRIVQAEDANARAVYRMIVRTVDIYAVGLLLTAYQHLISSRLQLEIATVMLVTAAIVGVTMWGLYRLGRRQSPRHGFVELKIGWLQPIVTVACLVCLAALVFGYVSLAGFISGRFTLSAGVVSLTLFVVTALNHLFDRHQPSETRIGEAVKNAFGVSGRFLDVMATAVSGALRFALIVVTGLIVLMPWGLEYGDVNPFSDFAAFITTTDLRNWLGSFGFALLAFAVGVGGTRLIVGWLDSALLPRMSLEESVRHSIRTVLGYAGFVATVLVTLSLMGINAQNVAVVAGALSVGIGFGLQSIVNNFVSGLIVLAERPVRVGDFVVVKGEEGRVQRISVRSTLIATAEQSSLIVPNSDLITSIVRNRTLADPTQQLRFNLLLDHDADPAVASDAIRDIAAAHPNVQVSPAPRILFMRITEVGQEFEIRCNIDRFENMIGTRSDLHHQIVKRFRENGIRLARISTDMTALAGSVSRAASSRLAAAGGG